MPKLKPPATLEKTAFEVLLRCVIRCCDRLSAEESLDELRAAISDIKTNVCMHMPSRFLAEFSRRFLDELCAFERPACCNRAALEIVMDIEIVGLTCKGPNLAFLDPHDWHRFRGLAELDLDRFPDTATLNLENFHLNDLTIFIHPRNCTDRDLTVIGKNCSKLEIVKIRESKNVTDEGLCALSPCSELRVIDIFGCAAVTHLGINHLLSVHGKLNDFAYGEERLESSYAYNDVVNYVFSHLDSSVQCASMNRFYVDCAEVSDEDLSRIVTKFPNLTYLGFNDFATESLSVLTSLNQLTGLEFNYPRLHISDYRSWDVREMWMSIKKILPSIGVNITSFEFCCCFHDLCFDETDLNFIMNSCPNIECLKFDHEYGRLVVPPFKNLKELTVCCPVDPQNYDYYDEDEGIYPPDSVIQFVELLKLESLTFVAFQITAQAVRSLMRDDVRFPNLSAIETNGLTCSELAHLERIARFKNLDFHIKNHPTYCNSIWYEQRGIAWMACFRLVEGGNYCGTLDIQVTDQ